MSMKNTALVLAAVLAMGFGANAARADDCSGHDHAAGTVLGAAGGGLLGGLATHGNGLGIVGGAILGGLAGNALSRDMDCADRPYAARSYQDSFRGRVGRQYHWRHGRDRGYVVTNREYRRRGEICRDFTQVVYRHGREFRRNGTACRPMRGRADWRFR